ncbi:unnamed protein product [Albugo candida]|uniref:Uncharacterized protein n=1 Tax=Albugo candida TaxID=65357 RepID=A0A024G6T5_9STRA|nr:unnamed protein product [Albugo candida]|eukprot:CCI42025.1 unnamed protein product [Albugo candida]
MINRMIRYTKSMHTDFRGCKCCLKLHQAFAGSEISAAATQFRMVTLSAYDNTMYHRVLLDNDEDNFTGAKSMGSDYPSYIIILCNGYRLAGPIEKRPAY